VTRRSEAAVLCAMAFATLLPHALVAQIIVGRVEADSLPVRDAEVVLADSAGRELRDVTDAQGLFRFDLSGPGVYAIRARHGDYAPAGPLSVTVRADEEVAVAIRLESPIPLAPIEVTARRRITPSATRVSMEERLSWAERTGWGHVLRREEIERTKSSDVRDLLRTEPLIHVTPVPQEHTQWLTIRNATGECRPQIYVDGVRDETRQGILDVLSPFDLEAVEIYRSATEAPPEYVDPGGCGVIAFWTRRDTSGGQMLTWKRVLGLIGVVGFMFFTMRR